MTQTRIVAVPVLETFRPSPAMADPLIPCAPVYLTRNPLAHQSFGCTADQSAPPTVITSVTFASVSRLPRPDDPFCHQFVGTPWIMGLEYSRYRLYRWVYRFETTPCITGRYSYQLNPAYPVPSFQLNLLYLVYLEYLHLPDVCQVPSIGMVRVFHLCRSHTNWHCSIN
jgi:hypothetical protein